MKNAQLDAATEKMQAQMASMSPDQRKMVEQMMASHGGMPAAGHPRTVQVCIGKDQAARGAVPPAGDGRCEQRELSRSGNSVKYAFTCAGEHPMSGTGEFTMQSPTAYTMHAISDAVMQGQSQHTEMDIAGKWIAADCGAVKPAASTH
jgi:hypothetical protein